MAIVLSILGSSIPPQESQDSPDPVTKGLTPIWTKGPYSQSYGFSSSHVWVWELDHKESWVPEIDAFELWCWRRLLRVPWTARRSNQYILKEINPEYSLQGLMPKLKPQYFGHLMWRADSLEKTMMLGKIEGGRRRGQQRWDGWMPSPTQWTWVWVNSRSWWWIGKPSMLQFMGSQRAGTDWVTVLNWTELNWWLKQFCIVRKIWLYIF